MRNCVLVTQEFSFYLLFFFFFPAPEFVMGLTNCEANKLEVAWVVGAPARALVRRPHHGSRLYGKFLVQLLNTANHRPFQLSRRGAIG